MDQRRSMREEIGNTGRQEKEGDGPEQDVESGRGVGMMVSGGAKRIGSGVNDWFGAKAMREEREGGWLRLGVWLRVAALAGVMFFTTLAIGGCNTVNGIGKDIKGLGEAIENLAD